MSATSSAAPWLIAMKGHPATGKSVVAQALAQRLRIPLIDKDDIKDVVLGLPNANDLAYAAMWQIAATQLALGLSVIAVSPLSYPVGYARACEIAQRHAARLLVVETVLPEAEWRRRLDARDPADSAHKIRGWEAMQAMLRQYAGCWQYPIAPEHHLVVDTSAPTAAAVEQVLARLGQSTHLDTEKDLS
ncbi:MAG TPA: ATP-binding protein [Chloroflexi bacterium]|nr:ATP-binding protein [Chloroflexota bacterium]